MKLTRYRNATRKAASDYLIEAHELKKLACSWKVFGFETFWFKYHLRIHECAFMVLHILMALVAGWRFTPAEFRNPDVSLE